MSRKLTLSLNDYAIDAAKKVAKSHHVSLSKMVEAYFLSLIQSPVEISPSVRRLIGVAKMPEGSSDKEILIKALRKKYL